MKLSSDLISQFVKVTTDRTETEKETTVYGTVAKIGEDNLLHVTLDGAEQSTPMLSTADAKVGDRVIVMIKNHTATVTGNVTTRSARSDNVTTLQERVDELDPVNLNSKISEFEILLADAVYSEEMAVERARIDTLYSDMADIGELKADKATIEELTAAIADVDELKADKAVVEDLQTTKLDAETASITYATIAELDAAKGDINVLESDVANIDTLIFGSATGTTIQTSFANAVIAQLGNAQIKSAMIESVSADKITAGDIITNNVRVKSEDGSLIISDETMQISDDTRVRVQIGKDASNDYSINIWDAEGNLMFSKGGITDSAIKEAIIRNDMVSDTANISAHKLDIDSLFEEINGSANTIKSTKIYLDDEGQTLDVAFKSLTAEVTEQGETISSQGTEIKAIQGQISSKIWQQDINTATDEMSTQYSTLEQEVDGISATVAGHTTQISKKADSTAVTSVSDKVSTLEQNLNGFKTTVSNTYATKTALSTTDTKASNAATAAANAQTSADAAQADIDNLEIGGRNLLRNSRLVQMYSNNTNVYPISCTEMSENGVSFYRVRRIDTTNYPNTSMSIYSTLPKTSFAYGEMTGKQVTLSFKARVSHEITCGFMDFTYGGSTTVDFGKPAEKFTTEWKTHYVVIDEFPDLTDRSGVRWNPYNFQLTADILADFYLDIRDYKFEFGNKPTDWTPAPEDIDSEISDLDTRISSTESSITQLSNKITANVTETTNLGTRMSTVEQTASGLEVRLDAAETNISTAQSTANTAKTNAATAQSTANTAKTNAATAQTTANNAAKTATNYLNFSSGGLVVGDMTASTLGKNVLIDSDSVDIRTGTTTMASFGANTVTLGRNAEDSVIDLCDGAGKISANTAEAATSYPNRNAILIESQEIETESVRFVASTSNKYGATSTPSIVRGTELYMQRSSSSAESCARLKAEHKTTSSGAYTNAGVSAMTYDAASTTRLLVYASDSANSTYNNINVYPTKTVMNKNLTLNGTVFTGKNKVLWTGTYYMSDTQTATLSEAISAQANGVVLVWSYYNDAADNSNFQVTYIPKHFITLHPGKGIAASLTNSSMNIMASKYVYVSDTSLKGYAGNDDAATTKNTGVLATPKNFVLRYVIGV